VPAQSPAGNAIPVTPDNFGCPETDMYFVLFGTRCGSAILNNGWKFPDGNKRASNS